jgi:lysosomal alpha-mannosidase
MGFDGLFIGRLDYQDKANRLMSKTPEMIWEASANTGELDFLYESQKPQYKICVNISDNSDLFTGVLYNNYGPPNGFCFDILCDDEPIIDDKHSPDYNVDRRVSKKLYHCEIVHFTRLFDIRDIFSFLFALTHKHDTQFSINIPKRSPSS